MTTPQTFADHELPVDSTLRGIVLLFRILGWIWLMVLAVLTALVDDNASVPVVTGAATLATAWTGLTLWAAGSSNQIGARWFVVADLVVALVIGAASTIAGAEDLFHGGYPVSTLAISAYRYGLRGALFSSIVLTAEQAVVHLVDGRSFVGLVGSIVFIVFAVILGAGFDALRAQERRLLVTRDELDEANAAEARHSERLELANRLHDTVLQTLGALRRDADDPRQVRYLARRQERQLKRTISEYRSPYAHSARAALQGICDEVEDVYRIEIDAVVRGDADVNTCCEAVLAATQEALVNAAKHSGADKIDLYAELRSDRTQIFVKDRGRGFDPETSATDSGLNHSLIDRVQAVGGAVTLSTSPNGGTEVAINWEAS
jgi:signal transduction histidine kinase